LANGTVVRGPADAAFSGVEIDSRAASPGVAFFALPGERTDGHDWVPAAMRAGARVAVVSKFDDAAAGALTSMPGTIVLVEDVPVALRTLARRHRDTLRCPVVGITGSTGKTSTKDFLVAALGTACRVAATRGNRNNELGVPLTVLDADPGTDVLVVEMGMRGEGEIEALCGIRRATPERARIRRTRLRPRAAAAWPQPSSPGSSPRYASMTAASFCTSRGGPSAILHPRSSTTISSDTSMTSPMSCSTMTMVVPSSRIR
jgi:hypothetical protein